MMNRNVIFAATILVLATVCVVSVNTVSAEESSCSTVEAVFARGSGQNLDENESRRFKAGLDAKLDSLKTSPSLNYYELGTVEYDKNKYPAVDVANLRNGNAIGAAVSAGQSNDYGKSVKQGVDELKAYLKERYDKCKDGNSYFVLAGYSQGAQVIGQALAGISSEIRAKILFAGLFGDPKLYLPEGEGFRAPACRGEELSAYRRVIANCNVDNGSLGARKPYLPSDMNTKTGLWCYAKDFVCGSTKFAWQTEGHGTYGNQGMAVDQAVAETMNRLQNALGSNSDETSDVQQANTDVVFVVDTTGSMGGTISRARQFAIKSADRIKAMNGRVALVSYRDAGDQYTSRLESPLLGTTDEFHSKMYDLHINGGGDDPEATLHALMTSFNSLEWRDGATKAAVVLTDATFHDPDVVDGTTIDDVVKRSLEIDPVNVYPVVPSWLTAAYQELADKTSGQVIANDGDTEAALFGALEKIAQRPVALLKNAEYSADPGQRITFDASDSYVKGAKITEYEWDYNGDGVFEETTSTPIARHVYDASFEGVMQVRLTASNGTIANASAVVSIGYLPETSPVNVPQNLRIVSNDATSVVMEWDGDTTGLTSWVIAVDDVPVGTIAVSQAQVTITDLIRTDDIRLSVAGMTSDEEVGEYAAVVLKKNSPVSAVEVSATSTSASGAVGRANGSVTSSGSDLVLAATDSTAHSQRGVSRRSVGDSNESSGVSDVSAARDDEGSNLLVRSVVSVVVLLCVGLVWVAVRKFRARRLE